MINQIVWIIMIPVKVILTILLVVLGLLWALAALGGTSRPNEDGLDIIRDIQDFVEEVFGEMWTYPSKRDQRKD